MRGLCNGLGPAMFGLIFYMFHVDLTDGENSHNATHSTPTFDTYSQVWHRLYHYLIVLFLCGVVVKYGRL